MIYKFAEEHQAIKIDINTEDICIMEAPVNVLVQFLGHPYVQWFDGLWTTLEPEHLYDICVYFELYHCASIGSPYILKFRTSNPYGDTQMYLNKKEFDLFRNFVQDCYDGKEQYV